MAKEKNLSLTLCTIVNYGLCSLLVSVSFCMFVCVWEFGREVREGLCACVCECMQSIGAAAFGGY